MIYYEIGKGKSSYVVLRCTNYRGRIRRIETYYSKSVFKCIEFIKGTKYNLKGFIKYE